MTIGDIVTIPDDMHGDKVTTVTGKIVRMGNRWVVIVDVSGKEHISNRLNAKAA